MIIDQEVDVKLNSNNYQYYIDKGYKIPTHIDNKKVVRNFKRGSFLKVKVLDLPPKSNVRLSVKCISCQSIRTVAYSMYAKKCWSCNLRQQKLSLHPKFDHSISESGKERTYALYLKRRYNLTLSEYYAILEKQNYKCKICCTSQENEGRKFAIDHNHKTGKVRGILCQPCNTAIGLLKEKEGSLHNALIYLKEVV